MEELPEICPTCEQGNLISEIITDQSENSSERVGYYSCGHRLFAVEASATIVFDGIAGSKVMSANKVRGKPEQEIEDRCDRSDRDHPLLQVKKQCSDSVPQMVQ